MATPNKKDTKTGGKQYAEPGLPEGTVAGINSAQMLEAGYFGGTSGAPEQAETKPFGTTSASSS